MVTDRERTVPHKVRSSITRNTSRSKVQRAKSSDRGFLRGRSFALGPASVTMSVKLSSQEGEEFEVPVELAKLSETVKHIMEGRYPLVLLSLLL